MYLCMYKCISVRTYVCVCMCVRASMSAYKCVYMFTHVHAIGIGSNDMKNLMAAMMMTIIMMMMMIEMFMSELHIL